MIEFNPDLPILLHAMTRSLTSGSRASPDSCVTGGWEGPSSFQHDASLTYFDPVDSTSASLRYQCDNMPFRPEH
jgi:hypothetical protein